MSLAIATKSIRDGAGNLLQRQVGDVSGGGGGPYLALMLLANAAGTGALDLEALNEAIVEAIGDAASVLPTGAATDAGLAAILAKLSSDPATGAGLTAILNKLSADPATQTTLASVLAKLNAGLQLVAGTALIGKVVQQVGGTDVSSTNPLPVGNGQLVRTAVTIASGTSLSPSADFGGGRLVGIEMPTGWTGPAVLTFQASADNATFKDVFDPGNLERTIPLNEIVSGRVVPQAYQDWMLARAIKLRSGTAAAAQNQSADRTFTLITQA